MRTRAFLAVAAVAASLLAVQHADATAHGQLTLTGSRTAYTDITLRAKTQFDFNHATITGGGAFAGMYAEAISKPVASRTQPGARVGIVQLRDFHGPNEPGSTAELDPDQPYLDPGRYRIYLVANAQTTVRIPITGVTSITLHPTRATYATASVTTDILKNPVQASNRQPIAFVGTRSIAFSSILIGKLHAFAGEIGACIAVSGGSCGSASGSGADGPYTGWFVSPINAIEFDWTASYEPGVIKAGHYDALQTAIDATTLQFASGAAFTLTLN